MRLSRFRRQAHGLIMSGPQLQACSTRDSHARGSAGETPFPGGGSCVAVSSRRRRFEMKPMWRQRLGALAGKTGSAFMDDIGVAGLLLRGRRLRRRGRLCEQRRLRREYDRQYGACRPRSRRAGNGISPCERGMTLGAFCVGVVLAAFILRLWRELNVAPLIAEAALVIAARFHRAKDRLSLVLIATAMGMQAVAVTRFRSVVASTVVVTTPWRASAEFGARGWSRGRRPRRPWRRRHPRFSWRSGPATGLVQSLPHAPWPWPRPLFLPAVMLALVAIRRRVRI